jgi:hypothetical protein
MLQAAGKAVRLEAGALGLAVEVTVAVGPGLARPNTDLGVRTKVGI